MKSTERHKLKENEFAHTVARTREMVEQRRNELTMVVVAVVAVAVIAGAIVVSKRRSVTMGDQVEAPATR